MATRSRQSVTATPRPSRQSVADPTSVSSSAPQRGIQLPEYEAPVHPLNAAAQQNIQALLRSRKMQDFDKLVQEAIDALIDNAGSVNDAVREKEAAVRKDKTRHERETADDAEEAERVNRFEADLLSVRDKVDAMTQKMEQDLRKMMDSREYFNSIKPVLQEVSNETSAFAHHTPSSTQRTQTRSQRRAARGADDGLGEDVDASGQEDGEEEYHDFTPTDPSNLHTQSTASPPAPTKLFRDKLKRRKDGYQNLTKTQRYASENDYRNFRRLTHDARYGDSLPLAHESTWFNDTAQPQPGVTAAAVADDSDDDLQIAKETISTKCPLTLQEFRHPVTSRLCPHSFEKEAILGMIDSRANTVRSPVSGKRAVQCPVPGCIHKLTKDDLHSDPVLLRKIQRIQRANAEAEDEDDDDDDDERERGGRDRPQEIFSDDIDVDEEDIDHVEREADARRIKRERFSGIPRQ